MSLDDAITGAAPLPFREEGPDPAPFGPWNPGLDSTIPRAFLPLASVFRSENVETSLEAARELSEACGLPLTQVVRFRPERLVIHEVLIRVMADLSVPMGRTYGDLGVNFRAIVATLMAEGVLPHRAAVAQHLEQIRRDAEAILAREVAALFAGALPAVPAAAPSPWRRLFGGGGTGPRPPASPRPPECNEAFVLAHLEAWQGRIGDGALERAANAALRTVLCAVFRRRGFLIRDEALLVELAVTLVSNGFGSGAIGERIAPWCEAVEDRHGFRRLAHQDHPVVMNVKGASASGKSTIRPYQRALVSEIGLDWGDFALITPDVWRKFLLDYDGLGPARRYAGPLTGHEVEIVDAKLDRAMARKATEGRIPHLLIDRFRFDSFQVDPGSETGSHLLTRFGHRVYMQFMITPPEATVERAWTRGEQFGRYKAVEDLLAHNVEAYTGMPRLFFTWALRTDKETHFEFLDNSVPEGHRPRTVAFGRNGSMTVLDPKFLLDIDRYRTIDIAARSPGEVYRLGETCRPEETCTTARPPTFLRDCVAKMHRLRFADHATGRVQARFEGGRLMRLDPAALACARWDDATRAAVATLVRATAGTRIPDEADYLDPTGASTLGAWGRTREGGPEAVPGEIRARPDRWPEFPGRMPPEHA